jgi:hypothetical protein
LIGETAIDFGVQRHVGDDFVFSLNAFPYRLAGLNLIPFDLEASREGAPCVRFRCARFTTGGIEVKAGAREKKHMGWKLTFALVLFSVAVVSALAAGGEPENEAMVREEATKQLSALREYLLRR